MACPALNFGPMVCGSLRAHTVKEDGRRVSSGVPPMRQPADPLGLPFAGADGFVADRPTGR